MTASPRPVLRAVAAAAILLLAAACGPEPAEIDRSPAAGMTAENPTSGRITGEVIEEDPPNQGVLELSGIAADAAPAGDAVVEVACALEGHGEHQTVTATLGTGGGARLEMAVHDYHGDGDYEAHFTLVRQDGDGAYLESEGTGTASLHKGTLLNTDAATHWISGTFQGNLEGEAGSGQASGGFERCFYFK